MNRYQSFSPRHKQLADILWSLKSAVLEGDTELSDHLLFRFLKIFDELTGPEKNKDHIASIRKKIVNDLKNKTCCDIEFAQMLRSIIIYEYN